MLEYEVFPIGSGGPPDGWSWICHDCHAVGHTYDTRSEAADAFWAHWPTDTCEQGSTDRPHEW